ncbi:MAG: phosphatidylglycerophosphatase A [Candidatus Pacebacteria bacterium]|nr:phosphatidylglycerophosphatase A [Candidatus Paceibacterota bacterium]
MKNFFIKFFATGLGLGYTPLIPGLAGVGLGAAAAYLIHPLPFWQKGVITLVLVIISIPLATEAEKLFQKKDCKKIIIDEVVGVLTATIWFSYLPFKMFWAIFFIYSFFDAVKVFPANVIEYLYGGWGVVFDDVVAGGYTAIAVALIFQVLKIIIV